MESFARGCGFIKKDNSLCSRSAIDGFNYCRQHTNSFLKKMGYPALPPKAKPTKKNKKLTQSINQQSFNNFPQNLCQNQNSFNPLVNNSPFQQQFSQNAFNPLVNNFPQQLFQNQNTLNSRVNNFQQQFQQNAFKPLFNNLPQQLFQNQNTFNPLLNNFPQQFPQPVPSQNVPLQKVTLQKDPVFLYEEICSTHKKNPEFKNKLIQSINYIDPNQSIASLKRSNIDDLCNFVKNIIIDDPRLFETVNRILSEPRSSDE